MKFGRNIQNTPE